MKKYLSFCLSYLLVFFSLTAQAAEAERDARALESLREIITRAFPLASYKKHQERDKSVDEILNQAQQTVQEGVPLFTLPLEIIYGNILPYVDLETLPSVRLICRCFSDLVSASFFRLNDYCLTETRAHSIPLDILHFKTRNTKDGLFKLAALASVSATDLSSWFEPDFLRSAFLPHQNSLPQQLEGQSEEDLDKLYSILKVALASPLVNIADPSDPVMRLLQEYRSPYGLSLNKLRLLSLNPARPGVYYQTLEQLVYPYPPPYISTPQARDVIARELLMAGRGIALMNNNFFVHNPQKREVAIEMIEWCIHNPQFCLDSDNSLLIHNALFLGRLESAVKVLRKVVELPNDQNTLGYKVRSFNAFKNKNIEDEHLQSRIQQFSENLYSDWAHLPADVKTEALSLMMHAERREEVPKALDDILSQPEEEILKVCQSSLISDLVHYHYPEEARRLVRYLLNVKPEKLISVLQYYIDDFFKPALEIDRGKSINLLKALAESDQVTIDAELDALFLLAQHAKEEIDRKKVLARLKTIIESDQVNLETRLGFLLFLAQHVTEEKDYVISQVKSLNYQETDRDDVDVVLCMIYYQLNNPELCGFYYQKSIQKALNKTEHDSMEKRAKVLKKLQEGGLNVGCSEDLLDCDPFTVISILEAKKD